MPATPSAGRSQSSSRTPRCSKSVTNEPSTSTAVDDEADIAMETDEKEEIEEVVDEECIITKKHAIRANLIGRLFAIMREQRDKTESILLPPSRVHDDQDTEEKRERLAPLNEHILQLEQSTCGMTLEEMLKDPKYANFSEMNPSVEEAQEEEENAVSSSSDQMHELTVKIEVDDPSASTNPTNLVLPSSGPETNVERAAKREAHVISRIAELRRNGMWSNSRLPKCVEPDRNKTHWDYVLEEVKWMATDFRAETNTKKIVARKLAGAIAKVHRDKEIEIERAADRAIKDKKKLCANIAKMVRDFWVGVDKVVEIRAKEIMDARVRKARDKNLLMIIGQVDDMTNIMGEGLVSSKSPSIASYDDNKDFEIDEESDSDDERTIANAEKSSNKKEVKQEVDALHNEANTEMDDLLATLPPEYLAAYGLTPEDLVEMKKENEREAAEKKEKAKQLVVEEDVNNGASTSDAGQSKSEEKEVEKTQDVLAEDGNGDGRGVLENVDYIKLNSENSDERQKELANIAEEALKFQPKGYTLETTQVKTPVPFLLRGTMREYQMVGLDWMVTLYEKNLNGILADEMGLGKTIQTISLIAHLACSESIWGPHLIVVPTSVILNWEMEFKKWCPALKILTYFGNAKDRAEKRKGWTKPNAFHVCITSYKTVTQDIRSFKQRAWQYLILDEAQNIKNWKSQRWQALLNVRARRRLLLTGTPLQNSLMELWSLMHFLMPTIFSSHDDFKDWFSNPLTGMMEGNIEYNAPLIQKLHKVLRPFILRRLKKEVEKQLPEKTEHVVKCSLSKRQRYLYDDFMSRRSTKENLKSGNMMSVLNIVMQLRKCCNHPNLFEPRPVVAPFVISKRQLNLPAHLFEICEQESDQIEIPQIFNISERIGSWKTSISSKKPLIEELEFIDEDEVSSRPPIVEGFRFNRNTYASKENFQPSDAFGMKSQQSVGSDEEGKINGNGISSHHAMSYSNIPIVPVNRSVPCFRSKTVLNTAPLTISTDRTGFNYEMGNSNRAVLDCKAPQSPPLKRQKLTGSSYDYSEFVPKHVLEKVEAEKQNRLQIVSRRFGKIHEPLVSKELISLLYNEISGSNPIMMRRNEDHIKEHLDEYIDILGKRFGMYVEPVLTDAFQCRPSSSGLPSYIRNNIVEVETETRKYLLNSSTEVDHKMNISRALQFPELRLIEYDCGKLQTLAVLLRQLYVHKHRCLIFTQMSKMLDVLQTFLSHHGYQYFRLDGSTGIEQRQAMMERFNADSKVFCFILSTRSGGVGINLTGADTVIFYDSDWNPTMDAQAQDRCHRIGQTRNVSIYRLISERTIEENILKKAMQKRRLGELAIDEAGFTPDFFKQTDNIRDLFDGENVDVAAPTDVPTNEKDLEKAMATCEDEADVNATKLAKAEAKVDNAEFDESAKQYTANPSGDDDSDDRYMELINQLKPIERYAISYLEEENKDGHEEACKEAEAEYEQKREEWDQKYNENPEDSTEAPAFIESNILDDDFYLGGGLLDEIFATGFDDMMPCWLPPSPPNSDNEFDLKMADEGFDLIYELDPMNETRLPSQIYELRRPLAEKQKQPTIDPSVYDAVSQCLQMPPMPDAVNAASPAYSENSFSMDDSSQDAKNENMGPSMNLAAPQKGSRKKKDNKEQNRSENGIRRATTPPLPFREELDYDGAEWNIVEDHALLQAVQCEVANQHTIERNVIDGMMFNWEHVATMVNKATRFYRSPRQCSIRYQMFVRPKEMGQLVASDPISKKTVKVELSSTELGHMRKGRLSTEQQYTFDCGAVLDRKHINRFKMVRGFSQKKPSSFFRGPKESRNLETLNGGMPTRHESKLMEFEVKPGTIKDAEDAAEVTEEQIKTYEAKCKQQSLLCPRPLSPEPCHSILIARPYSVPMSKLPPLPVRTGMKVEVPPLHVPQPPTSTPAAPQPPPAPVQQSSRGPLQAASQNLNIQSEPAVHQTTSQVIPAATVQHLQSNQLPVQRRTMSMANVQGYGNNGQSGGNFVFVNQQSGMNQDGQPRMQYVQQVSSGRGTGSVYGASQTVMLQQAGRGQQARVVRILQTQPTRQVYLQHSNPNGERPFGVGNPNMRVLQNGRVMTQMSQRRMAPTGNVTSVVMPQRPSGMGQQQQQSQGQQQQHLRPVAYRRQQQPYAQAGARVNVMVSHQSQMRQLPAGQMTVMQNQHGVRRVVGRGSSIAMNSRNVSPHVSQVVLAPQNSNNVPMLHVQRPAQNVQLQQQQHAQHSQAQAQASQSSVVSSSTSSSSQSNTQSVSSSSTSTVQTASSQSTVTSSVAPTTSSSTTSSTSATTQQPPTSQ